MTKEYSWMLGPFEKAAEANPCLVPNAVSRFFCPVQEKELGWEAKDVFNPAAAAKDDRGKICRNLSHRSGSQRRRAAFYHHAGACPLSRKGRIFCL